MGEGMKPYRLDGPQEKRDGVRPFDWLMAVAFALNIVFAMADGWNWSAVFGWSCALVAQGQIMGMKKAFAGSRP